MRVPELSHLCDAEYLLVDRASELFLELVAKAWRINSSTALESLWESKEGLMKYFSRAFDYSTDNPEDFLREMK
jgi:hypothetical protein